MLANINMGSVQKFLFLEKKTISTRNLIPYRILSSHRELMLVADALRLGGAILSLYPDMLAPQLVGRLLPEIGSNKNIKNLLVACDASGSDHCALIPLYHCLHTPGGPLKVRSHYPKKY